MARLRVNGKDYDLFAERIKLGQIETLQEIAQATDLNVLLQRANRSDMKAIVALVWLGMNTADATVTVEQVRAIELESIEFVPDEPEPEDSPFPPAAAPTSPSGGGGNSPREAATTGDQS